jgi:hypothetical protein
MQRTDGDNNIAGEFADPSGGTPGTRVMAKWLNAVQEEIAGVVEAAGLTLDEADNGQLQTVLARITAAPTWVTPALNLHWASVGAGDTVQYTKDALRVVRLRGTAQCSVGFGTTIWTMPAGFRPAAGKRFIQAVSKDDLTMVTLEVDGTNGTIKVLQPSLTAGDAIELCGVHYFAES